MKHKTELEKLNHWTTRLEETMEGLDGFIDNLYLYKLTDLQKGQQAQVRDDLFCIRAQILNLRDVVDELNNKKTFWQKLLRK